MNEISPRRRGGARTVAEQASSRLQRRSFLKGAVAAGAAAYPLTRGTARAVGPTVDEASAESFPFYGIHQAGIDRPPPRLAQSTASFASFDVTVANRRELTDVFRTLTERARFLTSGGTPPKAAAPGGAPQDDRLLGGTVVPGGLTLTVAVGESLFDDRYGLAGRKPVQLETMQPFEHDNLNQAECHGDLLLQLCASHRDVLVHAFLDVMAHTDGALRPRWRADAFNNPPRPSGTPRDMLGFKDGIANPDTGNAQQMNQQVWVQPGGREPSWTMGGTYQAVRIVRFFVEEWNKVPVGRQERIIGRRKVSGAPMYGTDESQDPVYNNDPQGKITPLDSHIRLANPQTPETVATSKILRRSYQYDRTSDAAGDVNIGHVFCCFQQELNTYIAMQTRLEGEPLVTYISPTGGGYFFVLPGVRNSQDYYARGLLA
ncbi:MAG: Dyp-type peroxidase [Actinoallomurus sp.]|jgi:deferrochelatase/peroxidase EfeB|nr:Dyp-type peroxidase [Actinoallomurus sp.]